MISTCRPRRSRKGALWGMVWKPCRRSSGRPFPRRTTSSSRSPTDKRSWLRLVMESRRGDARRGSMLASRRTIGQSAPGYAARGLWPARGLLIASDSSLVPELLPPVLHRHGIAGRRYLRPDLRDRPAGQLREGPDLLFLTASELDPVPCRGLAGLGSCPWVSEDITPLEVRAVRRLLEDEVLGKVRGVVADVEPREEDVASAAARAHAASFREPEDAELAQLFHRQGIGGTRIAPSHVPRVLEKGRVHVLPFHRLREHRLVERAELRLDEEGKVHARRQPHGAVVRGLHPALPRERIDVQLLRPVGVDHSETDREHELGRLVSDLQRAQVREAELRLLTEVDARHEESHVL